MAQIIDISKKITNELPVVKITEELVVTVNNRKSVVLNIQAMVEQMEREGKDEDTAFMTKVMEMLIGKKHADEVEKMDLPLNEYTMLFETIMSVATGEYGSTPSEK
ncbi:MAG: hypothetical protein HFJ09_13330 [Lachnospiraceae bacterium]|nr:hypothetical protein [Lachnospiraceae bacterium]